MIKNIILTTTDVQGIIAGRKTRHTTIAPVPVGYHNGTDIMDWGLSKHPYQDENGIWRYNVQSDVDSYNSFTLKSPYGPAGDQEWKTGIVPYDGLYWSEAIERPCLLLGGAYAGPIGWKRMGAILCGKEAWGGREQDFGPDRIEYKATETINTIGPWRSPVTMPREAARIWLEVVSVTVRRAWDITDEIAKQHGVDMGIFRDGPNMLKGQYQLETHSRGCKVGSYLDGYKYDHMQRYGPDSWQRNDWVFSTEFRVLSTTGKPDWI